MTAEDLWPAPVAPGRLDAHVSVPGSKSLTNRLLVLAACAERPSRLVGALEARDTRLMCAALEALGARIERHDDDLVIQPFGTPAAGGLIDCGLAGTVMRFVPPLAALAPGSTRFTGDEGALVRPLAPLLSALRGMGATVIDEGEPGFLPFEITGPVGARRSVDVDASTSSQFLSALLLMGAAMDGELEVRSVGDVVSMPHVRMTVLSLREAGLTVDDTADGRWVVGPGRPRAGTIPVEPDLSNAGVFLAAAMVCGGTVTVDHWPCETTQAGDAWRSILSQMGARVRLDDDGCEVLGPGLDGLRGVDLDLSEVGELAPTVAALATLATGPSSLTGIGHLRGHETDRLSALATEIGRCGGIVEEGPDYLRITPAPLHATDFETYRDHRMATFAAIIGLAVPGCRVRDIATTDKTLPDFPARWASVLGQAAGA